MNITERRIVSELPVFEWHVLVIGNGGALHQHWSSTTRRNARQASRRLHAECFPRKIRTRIVRVAVRVVERQLQAASEAQAQEIARAKGGSL